MKQEPKSLNVPGASTTPSGSTDPLLQSMRARGIALTREAYLNLAYPNGAPNPLPPELEAGLPSELRKRRA